MFEIYVNKKGSAAMLAVKRWAGFACFAHFLQHFSEFVLGSSSCFNIKIAYLNFTFCGAQTPSFCMFRWKFKLNENTTGVAPEVKLRNPFNEARNQGIQPGFENQGRHNQKS